MDTWELKISMEIDCDAAICPRWGCIDGHRQHRNEWATHTEKLLSRFNTHKWTCVCVFACGFKWEIELRTARRRCISYMVAFSLPLYIPLSFVLSGTRKPIFLITHFWQRYSVSIAFSISFPYWTTYSTEEYSEHIKSESFVAIGLLSQFHRQ